MSPRVGDLDLLQHLARDRLDVLVVDLHALQSIDLLDLVDEILGQLLDAEHAQDVVRHRVAVDQDRSPRSTKSPSWTAMRLVFGIRYSTGSAPSPSGTIRIVTLVLVVLAELDAARDRRR